MKTREVIVGPHKAAPVTIGGEGSGFAVIAGPCVIEDADVTHHTARAMKDICSRLGLPFIFKSSFDKANRTSADSYRGPGFKSGLDMLGDISESLGVPVISDIHEPGQAAPAAEVLDCLQIPAFLCRQTDIIVTAARTGKPVNVKKGQFLAPWDVTNIIGKYEAAAGDSGGGLMLTERGTSFGYNNLVVDFRGIPIMRGYGWPVVYDLTHSLQLPGGEGSFTGGMREHAFTMLRAAAAVGIDAVFMEVHPEPSKARCDSTTMLPLSEVEEMLRVAKEISAVSSR